MFYEGHKKLYLWCAAKLGAVASRKDVWEAVEGDKPEMLDAKFLENPVTRRCLINVAIGRGKRRVLEYVCSVRFEYAKQVAEAARKCISVDGLNAALTRLKAKDLVSKDLIKHFEANNCGSVVEWLCERAGSAPILQTILWYACRNADAAHMRWAISKGAFIQPFAYEMWGKMGRFDIIDELDQLTNGMSKGIHPNRFVYPVAMELLRTTQWKHLGQLVRRYGLDGMPVLVKNLVRRTCFLEECDTRETFDSPFTWTPMPRKK
jgi:hypothetical protein